MASLVISQVVSDVGHHNHSTMYGDGHRQTARSDSSSRPIVPSEEASPESSSNSSTHSTSPSQPPPSASTIPSQNTTTPGPPSRPSAQELPRHSSESHSHHSEKVANQGQRHIQPGVASTGENRGLASSPSSPRLQPTFRSTRSLGGSEATSPSRIKIRDLSHIQSFASEDFLGARRPGARGSTRSLHDVGRQYEISAMPVGDIIEMVAGLLTKITATNDQQHDHLHRRFPSTEESTPLGQHTQSVLAFHGKNVPSITILSYLSRIHKYCPTTYEVFLSLLVYFDRMTETVNRPFITTMQQQSGQGPAQPPSYSSSSMVVDEPSDLSQQNITSPPPPYQSEPLGPRMGTSVSDFNPGDDAASLTHFFVVDSFNIHRLVIAGVTCASKFFSDVFYTNSRYAKV